MQYDIAIIPSCQDDYQKAEKLSQQLSINIEYDQHFKDSHYKFFLLINDDKISLQRNQKLAKEFMVDFASKQFQYRYKNISKNSEQLIKALGKKNIDQDYIIDATAGFGSDSFILASLGYRVTLFEKSPIIALLLENGLERAMHDSNIKHIINNITLYKTNFIDNNVIDEFDNAIIYLDPMFNLAKKSANSKKNMQYIKEIVEYSRDIDCDNEEKLFNYSVNCRPKKIIVKRQINAATLCIASTLQPTYIISGKKIRYDIYDIK